VEKLFTAEVNPCLLRGGVYNSRLSLFFLVCKRCFQHTKEARSSEAFRLSRTTSFSLQAQKYTYFLYTPSVNTKCNLLQASFEVLHGLYTPVEGKITLIIKTTRVAPRPLNLLKYFLSYQAWDNLLQENGQSCLVLWLFFFFFNIFNIQSLQAGKLLR